MTTSGDRFNHKPKASVIIPHLNQAEFLRRCLESLSHQSFPRNQFEVLVVDNGSDELPREVINQFDNVSIYEEHEPGPGPARNTGVRNSRGELLLFIDADCIADPGWVAAAVAVLTDSGGTDIVGGDVKILMKNPENPSAVEAYEAVFAFRQEIYINQMGFSGTGNLGVKRHIFVAVGPFPGISVAEDRVWGQRAIEKGYSATYCEEMIVYHPARENIGGIFDKWRRQTVHDYNEGLGRPLHKVKWLVRAFMVLGSILLHGLQPFSSCRLKGLAARFKAVGTLALVRLFRFWLMISFLLFPKERDRAMKWNR